MKKVKAFKYYYKKRANTEGCLSCIGNNWSTGYQVPPRYKYLVCVLRVISITIYSLSALSLTSGL